MLTLYFSTIFLKHQNFINVLLNVLRYIFPDVNALPSSVESSSVTVGAVVGSCVIGFIIGLTLTAVLCFFYLKRHKPRMPGSPHYISKQNPYVTVPLKEVRELKEHTGYSSVILKISLAWILKRS